MWESEVEFSPFRALTFPFCCYISPWDMITQDEVNWCLSNFSPLFVKETYRATQREFASQYQGGFPLSHNFSVRLHVNFTRVNKIETMYGRSRVNVQVEPRSLACTQTLFYFSFRSFGTDVVLFFFSKTSASSRAKRACENERGARERFVFPHPTPLRWWSINPLRFIFYHARSTDFEGENR